MRRRPSTTAQPTPAPVRPAHRRRRLRQRRPRRRDDAAGTAAAPARGIGRAATGGVASDAPAAAPIASRAGAARRPFRAHARKFAPTSTCRSRSTSELRRIPPHGQNQHARPERVPVQRVCADRLHDRRARGVRDDRAAAGERGARRAARGDEEGPELRAERSIYVVLKDWEQESEVILGLWAFAIIGYKAWHARRERALLARDLVHVPEGMKILPEDTREYARHPRGAAAGGGRVPAAARAAGGPVPLRRHAQRAGRVGRRARRLHSRGRPARLGALDAALHRVGDPGDRLHRHRARHRRRARRGAQGGDRRRVRRHRRTRAPRSTRRWRRCSSASC